MRSIYTKTGDDGYTGILGKGRVAKYDPSVEALGAIDEAMSAIGLARATAKSEQTSAVLLKTQRNLYSLMSEISAAQEVRNQFQKIDAQSVADLEADIAYFSSLTEMPNEFIIPGDLTQSAYLDLARTVVRRAERRVAELLHIGQIENEDLLRYLNRLSSLCFALEIYEDRINGVQNITPAKIREGP